MKTVWGASIYFFSWPNRIWSLSTGLTFFRTELYTCNIIMLPFGPWHSPKCKGSNWGDIFTVRIQQTKSKNITKVNQQWKRFLDHSSCIFKVIVHFVRAEVFVLRLLDHRRWYLRQFSILKLKELIFQVICLITIPFLLWIMSRYVWDCLAWSETSR